MVKVLLAEDMHMVRGALVALLGLEPDIEVVAEVASGEQIMAAALEQRPDVLLVDVDLPGKDGLEAAVEVQQRLPRVRILVLTALGRPGTLRRALSAKVDGFLLKDAPADQLSGAIRDVVAGRRVVDHHLTLAAWDSMDCPLTQRELEVLSLAAQGVEAAEIAGVLHLSAGTVRNYLTAVVNKLNARNRVDAIRIATEAGWL